MNDIILELRNVHLYYRTMRGPVKAVDGVSFSLKRGETLAVVGESGCGKSSMAYSIMKILPRNVHRYDGEVLFDDVGNIVTMDEEEVRTKVRWKGVSMVFQGAMNSLNPVLKVGYQIMEPLIIHKGMEKEKARKLAVEAIKDVGLPEYVMERYPHELSGGMKQRAVIAMALIMKPKVVILDEPTSALDVMTQANIMNLLKKLKKEHSLSYIFITHDLALASELSDRVGIMYAGQMVEVGPADIIFRRPAHPYTKLLLESVPRLRVDKRPTFIPGAPPDLANPPKGCRFRPRCPFAKEVCENDPPRKELSEDHHAYCYFAGELV